MNYQYETCAEIWKRQWENHIWTAKSLRHIHSDKTDGYCRAALIANAMFNIAEALGQ